LQGETKTRYRSCFVFSVQETIQLFEDMDTLARRKPSIQRTKLINIILECNFMELVQKMWRQELRPDLLETNDTLPTHLTVSLSVLSLFICLFSAF